MASLASHGPSIPSLPTTPILTLARTLIRPYHPSDTAASARQANDPEIARWMRNTFPHPYELQHAESFINTIALATKSASPLRPEGILLNYAICRSSDGAFVGGIGLKPFSDVEARTVELGYWLGREHWGRGYAGEAVAAFTAWAFATFPDLLRVEACVYEGNPASEAVLRRAGFQFEGLRRKAIWKNGQSLGMRNYGLLKDECPGLEGVII
ncbi:putative acetyltransferase [Diaporthe ampelina]|uniref:Putative acetyltransferase n=1 Tax=Diaporthe ampelina TaxID=1214573 RepID=A0A0G2I463_9PEZI|nr:putative acetyltransferase [Diaporthe ampelina]